MIETQTSIIAWATETFGPDGSDFRLAARANDELAELLRAIAGTEPCIHCGGSRDFDASNCPCGGAYASAICAEAADVMIVLVRLAERHGLGILTRAADNMRGQRPAMLSVTAAKHMSMLLFRTESALNTPDVVKHDIVAIAFYLRQICHALGRDLRQEVRDKMAINRQRRWVKNDAGRGHYTHVPDSVTVAGDRKSVV